MKEERAWDLTEALRDELGRYWDVQRPDKEERGRQYRWRISISQAHNLSREFTFPATVMETAVNEDLRVYVDATEERVQLWLTTTEGQRVERTEEERRKRQLRMRIQDEFAIDAEPAETLAEEFDSVDEIIGLSRQELMMIEGIGERRASKILHRYSEPLKERIEETSSNRPIPVIEDEDGVLRLPEEFESGNYSPKHPE